jgi:hypothetical protein
MKNNFKVGQIAYIVLGQKRIIVPVKIVEQIIKRTEENEHIDWNIQLPDDDQFILLSELKDNIYSHIDDAHNQLLAQAKRSIDKMINTCLELQEKTWPQPKNLPEKNLNSYIKNNIQEENNKIKIMLDDGTSANIIVPDSMNQ